MLSTTLSFPKVAPRFANWLPRLMRRFDNSSATLKNGSIVHLRQICSVDAQLIYEIYTQMSPDSRYLRFNAHLSDALCRRFAQETADQCEENGFGLLAYVLDDRCATGVRPLGIAYYVQQGKHTPEFAMSIIDAYQNLGLGKTLFSKLLTAAKKAGVAFLEAYVLPKNTGMRLLIQRAGKPFFYGEDGSYQTYRIVV